MNVSKANFFQSEAEKLLASKNYKSLIYFLENNLNNIDKSWSHNLIGFAYLKINKIDEAKKNFKDSICYNKKNPNPYFNLALINSIQNLQNDSSKKFFLKAIELDQKNSEYIIAYANYLAKLKNDDCIKYYQNSIEINPSNSRGYIGLGNYLIEKNKYNDVIILSKQYYNNTGTINPYISNNHGVALLKTRKIIEAIEVFNNSLSLNNTIAELFTNLGQCYYVLKNYSLAFDYFNKSLGMSKTNQLNHINCGKALSKLNKPKEALFFFKNALKLNKNHNIFFHLANFFLNYKKINLAIIYFKKSLELKPNDQDTISNYLLALRYYNLKNESTYLSEALKYNNNIKHIQNSNLKIYKNTKIKIGFVSGDFNSHPVARFLINTIKNIKNSFLTFGYYNHFKIDHLTKDLKNNFDNWIEIIDKNDETVSNLIKKNQIDVLIDLSGHTSGNRLGLFKLRSAPIQISWIGFLASTGIKEMDYLITDTHAAPDQYASNFSEKLIKLPDIWNTYDYEENIFKNNISPCLKNSFLTLGCFSNPNKIDSETIRLFSMILKSNEKIKIIFKYKNIDNHYIKNKILKEFEYNFAPTKNINFDSGSERNKYLQSYNNIDLLIDPILYNGGSTNFESIMMGVPIMSYKGNSFLSRCGYSINQNLGLQKLISITYDEYIKKINYFEKNRKELNEIRNYLLNNAKKSNLFNHEKFSKNFINQINLIVKKLI